MRGDRCAAQLVLGDLHGCPKGLASCRCGGVGYCVAPQLPKSVLSQMDGWPSRQESVEMSRFGFKDPIKEPLDKLFKEA